MKSYKEQLESQGFVIRKEVQYWSLEHAEKGVYQAMSGELEEVCRFWWEHFFGGSGQKAA